jgi:hypothetical protein
VSVLKDAKISALPSGASSQQLSNSHRASFASRFFRIALLLRDRTRLDVILIFNARRQLGNRGQQAVVCREVAVERTARL